MREEADCSKEGCLKKARQMGSECFLSLTSSTKWQIVRASVDRARPDVHARRKARVAQLEYAHWQLPSVNADSVGTSFKVDKSGRVNEFGKLSSAWRDRGQAWVPCSIACSIALLVEEHHWRIRLPTLNDCSYYPRRAC